MSSSLLSSGSPILARLLSCFLMAKRVWLVMWTGMCWHKVSAKFLNVIRIVNSNGIATLSKRSANFRDLRGYD